MTHLPGSFFGRPSPLPLHSSVSGGRFRFALAALAASTVLAGCGGDMSSYQPSPMASEKTVNLQWDPPVANEDGSALTDLAGYRVYYGLRSSSYEYVVDIKDPAATSGAIELPWSGTWYISAKSYRSNGVESSLADEIVYDHSVL